MFGRSGALEIFRINNFATRRVETMKRLVAITLIIVVTTIGVLILFGYQAFQTIVVKPKLLAVRECTITPQPLTLDADKPSTEGTQLSQFGYTITVPWIDKQKEYGTGNVTNVVFGGGQHVTLLDPEKYPDLLDEMNIYQHAQVTTEEQTKAKKLNRLFITMTHEEFYRRLLSAHPSGFSMFMSKREANQLKLFLVMKVDLLANYSALYSFTDGERRGFQLGNPQTDTRCEVLLFDSSNSPVHFWFSRASGSGTVTTQHNLDQIIKSFRWVRDKPNTKN